MFSGIPPAMRESGRSPSAASGDPSGVSERQTDLDDLLPLAGRGRLGRAISGESERSLNLGPGQLVPYSGAAGLPQMPSSGAGTDFFLTKNHFQSADENDD